MTEVVAALIWDKNRFLACQRPAHKARALLWEFVGGKVEPGETLPQALMRECAEELAINVEVGKQFMQVVHQYPDMLIRLTLFQCTIPSGYPRLWSMSHWNGFIPARQTFMNSARQTRTF